MRRVILTIILVLLSLFSFYVFSKYVKSGALNNLDFAFTVKVQDKINQLAGNKLDSFFEDAGFFASPAFSATLVLLMTFYNLFRRKKISSLVIPLLFGLLIMGEIYGKSVVHHPAPPFFLLKNPTTIFPKYYVQEEFSYPSGHAARAVFLAIVVYATLKKRLMMVLGLAVYIALISISRIYLGHHWLSDILGGILLGIASVLPVTLLHKVNWENGHYYYPIV